MGSSILRDKSYRFAIRIVKFCRLLQDRGKEFIISKQLLRSGTAIGALIHEAEFGQSKADFTSKMSISLKEANETVYWLSLLNDTGYFEETHVFNNLHAEGEELIVMLVASIRTAKNGDKTRS